MPGNWLRPFTLIDQEDADEFRAGQLQPQRLRQACNAVGVACTLRMRAGYDHNYYLVSIFLSEHFAHYAAALRFLNVGAPGNCGK